LQEEQWTISAPIRKKLLAAGLIMETTANGEVLEVRREWTPHQLADWLITVFPDAYEHVKSLQGNVLPHIRRDEFIPARIKNTKVSLFSFNPSSGQKFDGSYLFDTLLVSSQRKTSRLAFGERQLRFHLITALQEAVTAQPINEAAMKQLTVQAENRRNEVAAKQLDAERLQAKQMTGYYSSCRVYMPEEPTTDQQTALDDNMDDEAHDAEIMNFKLFPDLNDGNGGSVDQTPSPIAGPSGNTAEHSPSPIAGPPTLNVEHPAIIDVDAISDHDDTASEYMPTEPDASTLTPRSPIPRRACNVANASEAKASWKPNLGSDDDAPNPFA
jgi:hypothetical protein